MTRKRFFQTVSAFSLAAALLLGSSAGALAADTSAQASVSGGDLASVSGGNLSSATDDDRIAPEETTAPEETAVPEETAAPESADITLLPNLAPGTTFNLAAPDGLQWTDNWFMQWNGVEQVQVYWYQIQKDGEIWVDLRTIDTNANVISLSVTNSISESGTYRFRVASCDRENADLSYWSDWSEERTYVRPAETLGVTDSMYWDTEQAGLLHISNVDKASGYEIEIYREDSSGQKTFAMGTQNHITNNSVRFEAGTEYLYNLSSLFELINNRYKDAGRYYVTVRALSNNIDEIANGIESDFSPVYDLGQIASAVYNSISSALEDCATTSEALKEVTGTNSVSVLHMAMQSDEAVLNKVAELESRYKEENGVDVSVSVSGAALDYVNENQVSIVGAGLNAADTGDSIRLSVSVSEETVPVDKVLYSNSVQLRIELLRNESPLTNLTMPVTITMPIPEGLDASRLVILHYSDTKGVETVNPKINGDGTVTFTVTHFSTFVFAEKAAEEEEADASASPSETTAPDTVISDPTAPDTVISVPAATDTVVSDATATADTNTGAVTDSDQGQSISNEKSPKTGDSTANIIRILLIIAGISGIVALICPKKEYQN